MTRRGRQEDVSNSQCEGSVLCLPSRYGSSSPHQTMMMVPGAKWGDGGGKRSCAAQDAFATRVRLQATVGGSEVEGRRGGCQALITQTEA